MKNLYVLGVLLTMTIGIFLILRFGYEPAPVGVMKPSFFSQAEDIGAVVYRRFYVPIEEHKLVVFGIPPQPEWHKDIVRGFLKGAEAEKRPFDVLISEAQMPPLDLTGLPAMETFTIKTNTPTQSELVDAIRKFREQKKRVLIYTASVFSSHLLKGNPLHRYEKQTGESLFAITTAPLALRADQEFLVDPPCVGSQRDQMGTADLGCAILKSGRMFYRKKLPQDRFVAAMNSSQREDYLLMVSAPGQDQGTAEANRKLRMNAPASPR